MSDSWLEFWKEKNAFDDSMNINYNFFLKKVEHYVAPNENTVVLDIGSGPGNLEDAWYSKVKEIHGVDTSKRYNQIARQKHKSNSNVFFHDLPETDYLNFSVLGDRKFNIIIVMSVLQYYNNKQEIIRLIENLKKYALPGAVLLLCDLIVKNSFLKEVAEVLQNSYKQGKLLQTFALLFKLRFTNYYKVKKKAGLLMLSEQEWHEIIKDLKLNASFVEEPLTLQTSRKSIIVRF
ncbi:MAG TPA: methyltransferase domain-containing protein [Segetibacter sp.]|jgi:2-polyprenyl-3-methyl-5-hydroxy-6-metoxy-1,4-benzoquinol methylase